MRLRNAVSRGARTSASRFFGAMMRKAYWPEWEAVNLDEHRRFIAAVEAGDRAGAAGIIRDEHWGWQKHERYFIKFYGFEKPLC